MREQPLYLRLNVQVEPLWDQWYAWSHLIPPATAARNLTERHLRIMDSFIDGAQFHAEAVKNPKMAGGPFIHLPPERVDDIRQLRDNTLEQRSSLVRLSKALSELDALLWKRATGTSLEPLYAQVPDILRGYVELSYDLSNNPTFRIIESLIYRSEYYDQSAQSLILSVISGDDRPFVLSTPRLDSSSGATHLHWPFSDPRVDQLFRLKSQPADWGKIRQMLELAPYEEHMFREFLTPVPPKPYEAYKGSGARWRYFGHACILVETRDVSILLDPVLSYTYEADISRYTYEDLPDHIDFVLITHNHQDHILFETLLQLRHKIGEVIVPRNGGGSLQDPSLKLTLKNTGFERVRELEEMETLETGVVSITGLPFLGEHADLSIGTKLAYLVRLDGHSLLFAADSCNIEPSLYEHVHDAVGDVDVLFLGMECDGAPLSWLYGPLLFRKPERAVDQSRRLAGSNYDQAVDIVNRFRCSEVYVYAMGQEPWLNYVMSIKYTEQSRPIVESNRLIDYCTKRGVICERLFGEKEILVETGAECASALRA